MLCVCCPMRCVPVSSFCIRGICDRHKLQLIFEAMIRTTKQRCRRSKMIGMLVEGAASMGVPVCAGHCVSRVIMGSHCVPHTGCCVALCMTHVAFAGRPAFTVLQSLLLSAVLVWVK